MNSPTRTQTTLRMNEELDKMLEQKSKQLGISKNAYILLLIQQGLKIA